MTEMTSEVSFAFRDFFFSTIRRIGMNNSQLDRTIRRCTAMVAILLSLFILLFQGYLDVKALDDNIRGIWPIARYFSYGLL